MIVRRSLGDSNAALAGVTLVASFAISKASMATFSEERGPFGRWGLVAIVEMRGCYSTWRLRGRARVPIETSVRVVIAGLVLTDPFGEED